MLKRTLSLSLLSFVLLTGCGSEANDSDAAEVYAEDFVKDQLKAPSTADFCGEEAKQMDDGTWIVKVCVDAENSFGAKLRSDFYVKEQYDEDSKEWELIGVEEHQK